MAYGLRQLPTFMALLQFWHMTWLWFCRFTHGHEWKLAFEVSKGAHMGFGGESRQDSMRLGPNLEN